MLWVAGSNSISSSARWWAPLIIVPCVRKPSSMQPKFRDSHRHSDRVANVGNVYRRQLALTSRFLAMMEAHARLLCMSLGSSGEDFV